MRKKVIAWMLLLVMVLGAVLPAGASDVEFPVEDGVLVGYNGNGGAVVIPEGVAVIGSRVFLERTDLTAVTIPEGVRQICVAAFCGCTGLKEVTIPASMELVELSAFLDCDGMETVTVLSPQAELRPGCFGYVLGDEAPAPMAGITLRGYPGSTAETYAKENGLSFEALEGTAPELPARAVDKLKLRTVIEPQYKDARPFSEGMAAVQTEEGLWGYIDETGKTVIEPKYSQALSFQEGVALVARSAEGVDPGWACVYILTPDGEERALFAPNYYKQADGNMTWSQNAPVSFDMSYGSLNGAVEGCSGGVVCAQGHAYTKEGAPILPEDFSGFVQNYQTCQVLGPAVNGIIPCKALYYNREAYGQCFYMDATGKVLCRFPSADGESGNDPLLKGEGMPKSWVYAPDPETGRIVALDLLDTQNDVRRYGVYQGSKDLVADMDKDETWQTVMLSINPGFLNLRLDGEGAIYYQGYASVLSDDGWKLMPETMGRCYFLSERAMQDWRFGGESMDSRTFTRLGTFGKGAEDIYCPVEEDGHWHYVSSDGFDYEVEGPEGIAVLGMAGTFSEGIAPVYDAASGKTYLIAAEPRGGVLPMVKDSENVALGVYFPGFDPADPDSYGAVRRTGDLVAIQDSEGKIGFAALEVSEEPDKPDDPPENPFTDVVETSYVYKPILWAVEHNITAGTSKTTFSPGKPCTRAQIVTFLWRANGKPEPKGTENPFTDVPEDAYYYKAVLWAVENKITAGTSRTEFSPGSPCTRGQVVTFLYRFAGSPALETMDHSFTDIQDTGYYYKPVLWAVANNITAGTTKTTFAPNQTCTRGQIVTFLYRDLAK